MPAEGRADRFGQRLGAVNDEQPADLGIEAALDQIVDEGLHDGAVLGGTFDQAKRMLVPVSVDPQRGDQHQVVADVQAVDLDHQKVELRQIRGHPRGHAFRRQRHEPARSGRLRGAITGDRRQITLGQRTARLSLRVDTLISIRFIAQRPSQSSACAAVQVGSTTSWPS